MTDRIPENYQPYTPEQGRQDVSPLGFLTNGSSSSNVPNGVLPPTLENTRAVIPNGVTSPSGPGGGSSSNAGRLNNGSSSGKSFVLEFFCQLLIITTLCATIPYTWKVSKRTEPGHEDDGGRFTVAPYRWEKRKDKQDEFSGA
ncbi:hypothetical protein LA080_006029 [Diaporthe eres]|nr:hypothetical protein LA080_006029 [Diaporthe eres]